MITEGEAECEHVYSYRNITSLNPCYNDTVWANVCDICGYVDLSSACLEECLYAHSFAGWTDVTDYTGMYDTNGDLKTDLSGFTYAFESYCEVCGEKFTVDVSYKIFSALEETYDDADAMKTAIEKCYTLSVNGYEYSTTYGGYADGDGALDLNGYVPADEDTYTLSTIMRIYVHMKTGRNRLKIPDIHMCMRSF